MATFISVPSLGALNLICLMIVIQLMIALPAYGYFPAFHPSPDRTWPSGTKGYTLETMPDENTLEAWQKYIKHYNFSNCLDEDSEFDRTLFINNVKLLKEQIECDESLKGKTFSINKFKHWPETNIWYEKDANKVSLARFDEYKSKHGLDGIYEANGMNWIRYSICMAVQERLSIKEKHCHEKVPEDIADTDKCDWTYKEIEAGKQEPSTKEPFGRCRMYNDQWLEDVDANGRVIEKKPKTGLKRKYHRRRY